MNLKLVRVRRYDEGRVVVRDYAQVKEKGEGMKIDWVVLAKALGEFISNAALGFIFGALACGRGFSVNQVAIFGAGAYAVGRVMSWARRASK